jgi:hypothetical protein
MFQPIKWIKNTGTQPSFDRDRRFVVEFRNGDQYRSNKDECWYWGLDDEGSDIVRWRYETEYEMTSDVLDTGFDIHDAEVKEEPKQKSVVETLREEISSFLDAEHFEQAKQLIDVLASYKEVHEQYV